MKRSLSGEPSQEVPARSDRWNNLILLLIALVISLSGAEYLLRTLGYYGVRGAALENLTLVDDEIVDYRRKPNSNWIHNNVNYHINQHGWRDFEYQYTKEENTFRLVVVGDSVTNGYGVELEDIYAKHLERQLNGELRSHLEYEVLILSLGALNTAQEVHLLEVEAIKYDPDLIIVGYVLNDPAAGVSLRARQRRYDRLVLRLKRAASRSSLVHFTYKAAKKIWWRVELGVGMDQTADYIDEDYFSALHRDPQKWGGVVRAFEQVKRLSKREMTPAVLVIFPILYQLDDYRWTNVHDKVRAAAELNGIEVLDLLDQFRKHRQADLQVDNGDHVHPNALGHEVAGAALFDFLVSRNMVAPPEAIPTSTIQFSE